METDVLVSVIIANYNYGAFIGKAIKSVLTQTHSNFEIIVCDDGSTDDSVPIIKNLALGDKRIKLFQQRNSGQACALNNCFANAKGELLCILDSDDLFEKEKLQNIVEEYKKNPGKGLIIHKVVKIDRNGKTIGSTLPKILADGNCAQLLIKNGGKYNIPPASGIVITRELGQRIFPINASFRTNADGVIAELAQGITGVIAINKVLAQFRIHGNNISSNFYEYPSEQLLKKTLVVTEEIFLNSRLFFENYGLDVRDFDLLNNKNYCLQNIAYYIFSATIYKSNIINDINLHRCLFRLSGFEKIIYGILINLPFSTSRRILKTWWGQNRFKEFITKYLV